MWAVVDGSYKALLVMLLRLFYGSFSPAQSVAVSCWVQASRHWERLRQHSWGL